MPIFKKNGHAGHVAVPRASLSRCHTLPQLLPASFCSGMASYLVNCLLFSICCCWNLLLFFNSSSRCSKGRKNKRNNQGTIPGLSQDIFLGVLLLCGTLKVASSCIVSFIKTIFAPFMHTIKFARRPWQVDIFSYKITPVTEWMIMSH